MNEKQVLDLLAKKYNAEEGYVFLRQVPSGTGSNHRRTCDGLALQTWPSRGLSFYGFEVKCHRHDLMNELRNPAKADVIASHCHYWWLVLSHPELLLDNMTIPPKWGVMWVDNGKLVVKQRAIQRENVEDVTLVFVAGILRKVSEQVTPEAVMEEIRREAYRNGMEAAEKASEMMVKMSDDKYKDLLRNVRDFEKASGVSIEHYSGTYIGSVVQSILRNDVTKYEDKLKVQLRSLTSIKEQIELTLLELARTRSTDDVLK